MSHCTLDRRSSIEWAHKQETFISKSRAELLHSISVWLIARFDFRFSETDFDTLKSVYANNTAAQSIISKYDEEDVAAISLDVNSSSLWLMSPPSLQKLKRYLRENVTMKFRYSVSISRLTHAQSDVVEDNQVFVMRESDAARQELIRIIQDGDQSQRVHLPFLFPKFLKVTLSTNTQ